MKEGGIDAFLLALREVLRIIDLDIRIDMQ
jgi:hypothetical protein